MCMYIHVHNIGAPILRMEIPLSHRVQNRRAHRFAVNGIDNYTFLCLFYHYIYM